MLHEAETHLKGGRVVISSPKRMCRLTDTIFNTKVKQMCLQASYNFRPFRVNFLWISLPQGRNPFYLEPAVIITITDGNKLTHSSGVPDEVRQ